MIKKTPQKGSAHVAIIVILVVALLGTLGFVFWQNFIHKDTSPTTQVIHENQTDKKSKDLPEKNNDEGYVVVREWGIKFKTSVSNELEYSITSRTGGPTDTTYEELGLKIKADAVTDKRCVNFGADLYRQTEPTTMFGAKKIGDYYYFMTGAPGQCSENESDLNIQKAILHDLQVENIKEL